MRVTWSPEALADLEDAVIHLVDRNLGAALRLADRVTDLVDRLAAGDFEGPEQILRSGARVRSWPAPPRASTTSVGSDELLVVRIYHQARRPL